MIPSRGLARNPASALRYSLTSRTKPSRLPSTRQFSQLQSQSSVLTSRRLSRTSKSHHGHITPSLSAVRAGTSIAIASSVFAQRGGAARNLSLWPSSLWPFGSKSQTPQTPESVEPPQEPTPEPPAAAQSPVAEASTLSSTPAEPAGSITPDLSELPEDILREFDPASFANNVPDHFGFLAELGLDYGWGTTTMCQWLLEHIHVWSGVPWWGSIAAIAVLFRAVMIYPMLIGAKHSARLQKVSSTPVFKQAMAQMQEATYRTKDRQAMMLARSEMQRLKRESGASTWKPFMGLATIPFSYGMFRLIRGMANIPVPGMETGGLAWFTDLTVHDPFFILPAASVALGSLTLLLTQKSNIAGQTNPAQKAMMQGMKYFLPPLMFVGTAWLPAGLQWFFLWVSAGTVVQSQATITPAIRRWIGLEPLPQPQQGLPAGIQYQSPSKPASFRENLSESMSTATKGLREATGATEERAQWKKADDYESKRAEEEKQRAFRRMEQLRQRRHGR
ncbi:hypothetical protein F5Y08DRAFT_310703 [Xylaria arbuscula]|nr:hypothetical protein F5Y08DRAFT_310703 [Xylaria arbuscula]